MSPEFVATVSTPAARNTNSTHVGKRSLAASTRAATPHVTVSVMMTWKRRATPKRSDTVAIVIMPSALDIVMPPATNPVARDESSSCCLRYGTIQRKNALPPPDDRNTDAPYTHTTFGAGAEGALAGFCRL